MAFTHTDDDFAKKLTIAENVAEALLQLPKYVGRIALYGRLGTLYEDEEGARNIRLFITLKNGYAANFLKSLGALRLPVDLKVLLNFLNLEEEKIKHFRKIAEGRSILIIPMSETLNIEFLKQLEIQSGEELFTTALAHQYSIYESGCGFTRKPLPKPIRRRALKL
jgi:hypothetical protein